MNRRDLLIGGGALGAVAGLPRFPQASGVMPPNGWPGLPLWPDERNVGYLADPDYPGALTPHDGKALTPNTLYKYIDFKGMTVNVAGVRFRGCRFRSNWTEGWNVKIFHTTEFRYCTIEPLAVDAPPNPAWPSAGARENVYGGDVPEYMIPKSQSYQYGIIQEPAAGLLMEDCDIWGFGNAVCLFGAAQKTIKRCWIHDASHEGSGSTIYHQDGPGHLNNVGCSNVMIENCTIASLGNTNAIAFQNGRYDNIVVRRNFLSGFGTCVDMCNNNAANTNLIFKDNTIATDVGWIWRPLYLDYTSSFAKDGNKWERNVLRVAKGTVPRPGAGVWDFEPRNHYRFIHPDGSLDHRDFEG